MQDISDDILFKASKGDRKAFEYLYKAASGFVYNVALRVVNNREDAQEVTQEVFLIVYNKLKDFRFESSFKTWVYRITANYAINLAKKQAFRRNRTVEYDEALVGGTAGDVQAQIDKDYREKIIEQLLSALNPDQRACVVLRNIEGLNYQQIAETLKVNINTVRSRLKRAREKMMALKHEVIL